MVSLKLPKPVVRIFSKPSIRIDYHHVNGLNNYNKQLYLNCPAQSPLYVVSIPAMEATALQECTWITSTLAHSLLSFLTALIVQCH